MQSSYSNMELCTESTVLGVYSLVYIHLVVYGVHIVRGKSWCRVYLYIMMAMHI